MLDARFIIDWLARRAPRLVRLYARAVARLHPELARPVRRLVRALHGGGEGILTFIFFRVAVKLTRRHRARLARKAEENRKWRQKQRQQKKECPHLYRILYSAQQGYYVDPVMGITVAKRFDELDCGFWLNQQMNQAMY